jgi:hypothetical protein
LFDDEMYRLNIPQMDIMSDFVERVEELFSTMNGVWVWLHALTTNHRITSTWPTVDKLRQFDQLRTSSRGKVNPHLLFSTIHTNCLARVSRSHDLPQDSSKIYCSRELYAKNVKVRAKADESSSRNISLRKSSQICEFHSYER